MTRIASGNHFAHKLTLYQHSLSFLEAPDFNFSIFAQALPVSPRWKRLSLMTKASQGWSLELRQQSTVFKLSYSKVLRATMAPSFLGLFPIPSIRTPRKSWQLPLADISIFIASLMLAIKCDLVVFLVYLVKSLCLNVSFMFFSFIIFSPVLSNMFHHFTIYSQLFLRITPFRHILLVKKACVDTQKHEELVPLQLVWSQSSLALVSLQFLTSRIHGYTCTHIYNSSFVCNLHSFIYSGNSSWIPVGFRNSVWILVGISRWIPVLYLFTLITQGILTIGTRNLAHW